MYPNDDNYQLMQQLVQPVQHPIGLLLIVCQYGKTSCKATFCRVDKKMGGKFKSHQRQQQLPSISVDEEAKSNQDGMYRGMQQYWPWIFPIGLGPNHRRGGQAEVSKIMADKKGEQ